MLLVRGPSPRAIVLHPSLNLLVTVGALAIEVLFGYPETLFRAIRHPVVWIGALLASLDDRLNRPDWRAGTRRAAGALALALALLLAVGPVAVLQWVLPGSGGVVVLVLLASALPAQRSLFVHVRAVADALEQGGLHAGRQAVSRIVGRDPDQLDGAGVVRAAVESLAENFSDGVVAPAVWGAVLGLPGMAAYKVVNTADSMLGHRTPRHDAFGWASARLDDLVNLPASRLSAVFLLLAAALQPGADPAAAFRAVRRDASRHRSPNAGWPEAAMAGALGLRLAGPRVYGGTLIADAWMGEGRAEATPSDLRRALRLYRRACAVQFLLLLALLALTLPF